MNILQVINSGRLGGAEKHITDLSRLLIKYGHDVRVVCNQGKLTEWLSSSKIPVEIMQINFDIDPIYIYKLSQLINKNKIDIVHAHELKAGVNAILAAKLAGNCKVVTHIHTPMSEWQINNPLKRKFVTLESKIYSFLVNNFSNAEIALTESRKQIKLTEGISDNKLKIIPNGVDTQSFNISSETQKAYRNEILKRWKIPANSLIFGYVGRLTPEKGHSNLINAFSKFLTQYKGNLSAYLLLAGGGELEISLKDLITSLNINDRVIITGIFDQEDAIKYYSTFDFFVFPSLAEGFGLVFIEAMAAGLPVLASNIPVLREVGFAEVLYFEPKNTDDICSKLISAAKLSHQEQEALGQKLKTSVNQKYSMQKFIESYISLYESFNTR